MRVSRLYLHPVKSLGGISVSQFAVDRFGPHMDRRWLVVDARGQFLTQRQLARMVLVRTALEQERVTLSLEGQAPIQFSPQDFAGAEIDVQVWRDRCVARTGPAEVDQWLCRVLGVECRLVFMPDATRRAVNTDYAHNGETVGFADGFPLLLTSEASLDDLNSRLPFPIGMERFRPNLVVEGTTPFAEDQWRCIRVGSMIFQVVKPCSRCVIPTLDPLTAQKQPDVFKTLKTFRARDGEVYFGQNLLAQGTGRIQVGDTVEILA